MLNLYEFQQYCKDHTVEEIAEHFGMTKANVLGQIRRMNKAAERENAPQLHVEYKRVRNPITSRQIAEMLRDKYSEEAKMRPVDDLKDPETAKAIWRKICGEVVAETGMTVDEINAQLRHYKASLKSRENREFYQKQKKRIEEEKEKKEVFGENVRPKRRGKGPVHGTFDNPRRVLPDLRGN